jgi:hypothetical protein
MRCILGLARLTRRTNMTTDGVEVYVGVCWLMIGRRVHCMCEERGSSRLSSADRH